MTPDRNFSLDAARGVLMVLGIFIHAANIYAVGGSWLIADPQQDHAIGSIANFIHAFRIPTFFWISGYFCAHSFVRNGSKGLMQRRVPRLAVPLVFTWLTLNFLQSSLLSLYHHDGLAKIFSPNIPIYHLWFLVDLIIFIAVAAVLLPVLHRCAPIGARLNQIPLTWMLPALAAVSVLVSLASRATGLAYEQVWGVTSLYRLASNIPFFMVGVFMYGHANARQNFLRIPAVLALATIPLSLFFHQYARGSNSVQSESAFFCEQLLVWVSVAAVLRFFHEAVQRDNKFTRFLNDSAYTIYLSHHILVFSMGVVFMGLPIGAWPKFLMLCGVTFGLASLLHIYIIRRSRLASMLFNGK